VLVATVVELSSTRTVEVVASAVGVVSPRVVVVVSTNSVVDSTIVVGVVSTKVVRVVSTSVPDVSSAVEVVSAGVSDVASVDSAPVDSVKEVSNKTVEVPSDATVDKVWLWMIETAVDVASLQGLASAPSKPAATTATARIDRQPILNNERKRLETARV